MGDFYGEIVVYILLGDDLLKQCCFLEVEYVYFELIDFVLFVDSLYELIDVKVGLVKFYVVMKCFEKV